MLENYEENFTVELEHPSNFSGRIRYTFASFWSRNRTFRALEAALQSYEATLEAEKQVLSTCSNFRYRVRTLCFGIFSPKLTWCLYLFSHKQVRAHVLLQIERNSVFCSKSDNTKTPEKNIEKAIKFQPFINDHVLADVTSVSIQLCFSNSSDA